MQVDGGSNCGLLADKRAAALAGMLPSRGMIGGIAGGLPYTSIAVGDVTIGSPLCDLSVAPLFIPFNLFLSLSTFTDRSTIIPSRTQVGGSVRS